MLAARLVAGLARRSGSASSAAAAPLAAAPLARGFASSADDSKVITHEVR